MPQVAIAEAPRITCQQYTHIRGPNLARKTSADVQAVVSAMHFMAILTEAIFTSVAPLRLTTLLILAGIGYPVLAVIIVASMTTASLPTTRAIAKLKRPPPNLARPPSPLPLVRVCVFV